MIPQKILALLKKVGIPYLREDNEKASQILLGLGLESEIFAYFATTYGSNLPNPKALDELIDIALDLDYLAFAEIAHTYNPDSPLWQEMVTENK